MILTDYFPDVKDSFFLLSARKLFMEGLLWDPNKKAEHKMEEHPSCDSIMSDSTRGLLSEVPQAVPTKEFLVSWPLPEMLNSL